MNLIGRLGLFAGGLTAAVAGASVGAALLSVAALTDSYDGAQVATVHIACPDDPRQPCLVDVRRVRPLKADAKTEARQAGLEAAPAREVPAQVTVSQADVAALINGGTPVP